MAGAAGRPGPEDPYRVLGLEADASPAEITRAFRRLARARHPDVHGGTPEAHQEYRRIRGAYELLSDPGRRAAYDTRREMADPAPQATGRRIPVRVRSQPPRRGGDAAARVRVTLTEAVYGATRRVPAAVTPPGADGPAGNRAAAVRIPAGTVTGTRLRLRGLGEPGRHGGPPGDLVVTVEVAEHPRFRQRGRDLHTTVTVGYPELVLGADLPVETLDGHIVTVHVPPGTTPGARLRAAGLGVPATGHAVAGDMIVETALYIPAELTAAARDILTSLAGALPVPRGGARPGARTPAAGEVAE